MTSSLATLTALQDLHLHACIQILTNCQSLNTTLSGGPARQSNSVCNLIWLQLSRISKILSIHDQWIPAHISLLGNTLADSEAKRGSTLPQSSVLIKLAPTAKVLIRKTGQEEFHARYLHDPLSQTSRSDWRD